MKTTDSNEDYYREGRMYIFTARFLLNRGSCCGNKCRHCPYEKPPKKGNTKLELMKKALYLDDVRTPTETMAGYEPWYVVRNYDEFTAWITENGVPDMISFDHDLADEHMDDYYQQIAQQGYQHPSYELFTEKTGLNCADWLISYCQDNKTSLKKCCVHSHNPVGAANIQSMLNGFKKHMGQEQDCFTMRHPFKVEKL
jgi:hypothetical protein